MGAGARAGLGAAAKQSPTGAHQARGPGAEGNPATRNRGEAGQQQGRFRQAKAPLAVRGERWPQAHPGVGLWLSPAA